MSSKTPQIDPRDHQRADESKPMTHEETQAMYAWSGDEDDCPEDLFINASNSPIIIGSQAGIPGDSSRIDPGDRVQGTYYAKVLDLPIFTGLQKLSVVQPQRRLELEQQRLRRSGDLPPEWCLSAWEKLEAKDRKKYEAEYGALMDRAREAREKVA